MNEETVVNFKKMTNKTAIEFIWLPAETELLELKSVPKLTELEKLPPVLAKLKAFLKNLLNVSLTIQSFKPRINSATAESSSSMFYAEYLFTVTCMFDTDSSPSFKKDFYKKLINKFCNGYSKAGFPELYLDIDTSILVNNPLTTQDSFIDLEGFSLGNIIKLNKFVEHFSSKQVLNSAGNKSYKITQAKVKFLHDEEKMNVNFFVGDPKVPIKKRSPESHRMFSLEIPYSLLHTIIIYPSSNFLAYFRLYRPPMVYAVQQNENDDNFISYMNLSPSTKWIRCLNLFKGCSNEVRKEFTMNSVVCLTFPNEEYEVLKIACRHKNVQVYFAYMNSVPFTPLNVSYKFGDFECYYGLQCLLTHSNELIDQLMVKEEMEEFKKLMKENAQGNSKVLSGALYKIHSAISKCHIVAINYSIRLLLERASKSSSRDNDSFDIFPEEKHENILLVKRAIIIPTHVRFLPPQPILKSRALRKCDPNYSLRLSIRDVNLDTINFSFKGFTDERKKHLREYFETYYIKKMLKGIKIGERIYQYVASSTSQLRGHGLWFYAEDENGLTADELRDRLGNMDEIKKVPKYMARMGQTFSQARGNITVPQKYTNVDCPDIDVEGGVKEYLLEDFDDINKLKYLKAEDDIKPENESKVQPCNFSDGIGRVSLEIVEEVQKELKLDETPVAMQIRFAGCKGMLVLDPNLKGKQIKFRKSMRKFSSTDDSLEVIKVNEPRVASLNRPLITILEQLGVPKAAFIKLQKRMIQNHIKSMFYEPEACSFLNRNSKLRIDFLKLHENGISFTEDPLFRSMIYALFQKQLEMLKNKASVEIPPDKGRAMFGTLDETFTLEYGQVFIQYTSFEERKRVIYTGTVVITKNPCMHPGDVRKFEAVDVEELHHIVDCVVFPAKGPRPHPDEMAGSDLDGDEYHVMWYEDFIFSRDNEPAMHYAIKPEESEDDEDEDDEDERKKKKKKKFERSDELNHLCNYIVHDNVGLIASAHLAFADKERDGIFSDNCLRLARKYAVALDFAKSGKIASKDHRDSVREYPDFMQKFGERNTYISKRALGILYRNCKRLEIGLESTQSEISYKLDPDLVYENWKRYEKSAEKVYKYYSVKVEYLMNTYSFSTEGELLTGALINPPKYYEQRHDLENVMTLLEYEMQWIFSDLENIFFKEFGGKPKKNDFTVEMYEKASAWYMVAYKENRKENDYGFFGLPWAVADVLVKLKQNKCRLKKNKVSNNKSLLEDTIDKRLSHLISHLSEEAPINEIFENRLNVLDIAETVLKKWLDTQKDHVMIKDLEKFKKIAMNKFDDVTSLLQSCGLQYIKKLKDTNNLKKAISPAYFIIETLLQLACIEVPDEKASVFDARQEVSLLSWVTLIKLACTYNPDYLGIGVTSYGISLIPQDNIVSTFKLNLFENNEYNEEFSLKLLQKPHEVIEYLQKVSKIKEIDFRYSKERGAKENISKYAAKFTVKGSRYAIEKLKDLVVQEEFYMWVIKNKTLFATQSSNT